MTTVKELIEELSKMPNDLPVTLNLYRGNEVIHYNFGMSPVHIEKKTFGSPYSKPGEKQEFVILNQRQP